MRRIDPTAYRTDQQYTASELLTVWRTLHMEVDSMGIVTGNSETSLDILSIVPQGTGSKVTLNTFPFAENAFEHGRMEVALRPAHKQSFAIVENNAGYVITATPVSSDLIGKIATLFDDDDMNFSNTDPQGDIGEDVPVPDRHWMTDLDGNVDKLNSASIRAEYDLSGGYDESLPFVRNCPQVNGTADQPTLAEMRSLTKFDHAYDQSQVFWIGYIMSAYQGPERQDGDPNTEGAPFELSDSSYGAVVFTETMYDYGASTDETSRDYSIQYDPRFIAMGAVGHSLGLGYEDGGLMSNESADFSPTSIAKLRFNKFPRVGGVAQLP